MVKAYQAGREKSTTAHRLLNTRSPFLTCVLPKAGYTSGAFSGHTSLFQLPAGLSRSGGNFELFEDILQRDLVPLQLVPELHPHS
jgi:hypothetical protein